MSDKEEFIGEGIVQLQTKRVAFQIYKLDGDYAKMMAQKAIGEGIKFVEQRVPRGYLIKFPKVIKGTDYSHSVHLDTWDAVKKAGFAVAQVAVVDDDGIPIAAVPNEVIKGKRAREQQHA